MSRLYINGTLRSPGLSNHNDLLNIQGGSASERYHLSSANASALISLLSNNPSKRSTGTGNPVGVVTGIAGDIYVDTSNVFVYMNVGAASNTTSWVLVG